MHRFLYPILLVALVSCSASPDIEISEEIASLENLAIVEPDANPRNQMEFTQAATFGDTEDVIIGQMGEFTVDEEGRVYVADRNRSVIHVYSPQGEHLTTIGREGDGPGEFRQIRAIRADNRELHVMDTNTMRISRFSLTDHSLSGDLTIPFKFEAVGGFVSYPGSFYIADSDHYLVHFWVGFASGQEESDQKPMEHGKLLNRLEEEFLDNQLYEFPMSESIIQREGNSLHMMSPDYKNHSKTMVHNGVIAHGWSEHLLFKFYDLDGSYDKAIYHPSEKTVLDRDEILLQYSDRDEPWRSMIRNDNMPDTWPAFQTAVLDDEGRVWASTYTEDDDSYTWKVLDGGGELSASFTWPRGQNIRLVKNGFIYTRESDEDTGLEQIVKYHAEKNN